jgi:hypothetical protein
VLHSERALKNAVTYRRIGGEDERLHLNQLLVGERP